MKDSALKFIYLILKRYAQKVIRRHNPFVIAITGSVGKTTTKEFTYKLFCDAYGAENVRANAGNMNAEIGVPLTILGYKKTPGKIELIWLLVSAYFRTFVSKYPKYLIIEMGVERPGDIEYLCSIVQPNVGVVTAATPAHVANFRNLEQMQFEKVQLFKYVKDIGIANADDEYIKKSEMNALEYSLRDKHVDCYASNIEISIEGTSYDFKYEMNNYHIKNTLLGKQMIYSQMAAFLAAVSAGVAPEKAALSLQKLEPYHGRMNLISGENDVTIIDDTYNANPASSAAAIETLHDINFEGRKVLVHGNMNELGNEEEKAHLEIGEKTKGKVDLAIFMGKNASLMQKGFGSTEKSIIFNNRTELLKNIKKIIQPGDLVLIKGSQNGNFLEEVTKLLMKDRDLAKKILVRQSNNWLRKKR